MGVGKILDTAVSLYRLHWRTLLGITAFVLVPYTFLQQLSIRLVSSPFVVNGRVYIPRSKEGVAAAVVGAFSFASFLIVQPFLTGATVRAVGEFYRGRDPGVRGAYSYALRRVGSILLVIVLSFLAFVGGFILLVIPAFIFHVRFLFSTAVVVEEDARGRAAMRRSWRLAKGSFWKILGTVVLASLLAGIAGAIISLPASFAAMHVGTNGWILRFLGGAISGIITGPFITTVTVLLYYDMRIRKEGFDIQVMAQELQGPTYSP
ncbi:MAG: glycerophosphoryl diester phosphodiesterase membrane domain-containing protein [Actinomycetota bacterium]